MKKFTEKLEEINKEHFIGLMPEEAKQAIINAVIERDNYVLGRIFDPAYGYESEEEKGYQKGLRAESLLVHKRADESI